MLHDISKDKRFVRRYDPRTGQIHVWRRGTLIPVSAGTRGEKAMDWDDVFPRPLVLDSTGTTDVKYG